MAPGQVGEQARRLHCLGQRHRRHRREQRVMRLQEARGMAIGVQREAEAQAGQQAKGAAREQMAMRALARPGQDHQAQGGHRHAGPAERAQGVAEDHPAKDRRQRQGALLQGGADGEARPPHGDQEGGGGDHLGDRSSQGIDEIGRRGRGMQPPALHRHDRQGEDQREREAEQEADQGRAPWTGVGDHAALQRVAHDLQAGRKDRDDDPEKGHGKSLSGPGRAAAAGSAATLRRYRKPPATRVSGAAFSRRAMRLLSALT